MLALPCKGAVLQFFQNTIYIIVCAESQSLQMVEITEEINR